MVPQTSTLGERLKDFPLLFFPAGNKTMDPVPVDADQTVVALYKFIKKHTSIPFKLPKPASSTASESTEVKEGANIESSNGKDEL
ncbi:hypothetical protein K7X08_025547 [Anisodus acutangulus]|uniref:Uncharacterized protein n=1 Tax=Anisodus acutangulus TaxID=402998 RepID=A0A9Q1LWT8_9SOLA|nr:hypothetical protein K7X08_025547 [Anisodus acutangulus]